jgi:hypothetical protein
MTVDQFIALKVSLSGGFKDISLTVKPCGYHVEITTSWKNLDHATIPGKKISGIDMRQQVSCDEIKHLNHYQAKRLLYSAAFRLIEHEFHEAFKINNECFINPHPEV